MAAAVGSSSAVVAVDSPRSIERVVTLDVIPGQPLGMDLRVKLNSEGNPIGA